MAYIGRQPVGGEIFTLDALTASATANYSLTRNGVAFSPETVEALLVSINGVVQSPSTMSLDGNTLTVGATLSASDVIDYVRVISAVGTFTTPNDGSVTDAKIVSMAASKLTGALPAISGANLTNLPAGGVSGITSTSSSGTAISIDSSNRVTLSNTAQPSWYMKKTNGNVGATNTIVFNDIGRAVGVTLSNGVVTLPVTGVYAVSFGFLKNGGDCDVEIRLNNNSESLIKARASSNSNHSSASGVIFQRFGAGDNIRCVCTNGTVHGANPWTFFSGYLVG